MICSAIYGGYDEVKDVVSQNGGCDFVLFTDDTTLKKDADKKGWDSRLRRFCYSNPRMEAKFPKLIPHVLLPEYTTVVWVDSQVQIRSSDYLEMMLTYLSNNEYAFIPHWYRDCVYDEIDAMYAEQFEKYRHSLSKRQVAEYKKEGMPAHFGLWAGTSWIKRNDTRISSVIGSQWFNEDMRWNTEEYSSNDQLALAYIIWKYDFKKYIGKIPYSTWSSMIELTQHNSGR